jgi:hypothetical protein
MREVEGKKREKRKKRKREREKKEMENFLNLKKNWGRKKKITYGLDIEIIDSFWSRSKNYFYTRKE